MSYDVMVIDPATVPTAPYVDFHQWYDKATEWAEPRNYSSTAGSSEPITAFYNTIIEKFPDMNGEWDDSLEDETYMTDYSIGSDHIYMGFAWSKVEEAEPLCISLAHQLGLAFVDVSGTGDILMPDGTRIQRPKNL